MYHERKRSKLVGKTKRNEYPLSATGTNTFQISAIFSVSFSLSYSAPTTFHSASAPLRYLAIAV